MDGIMKNTKADRYYRILLAFVSTALVLVLANSTSILQKHSYGYDSAIFLYVGKCMNKGMIPYRDMYDIKGPVLWLIEGLGELIHGERTGVHILEIINFNIFIQLVYSSAKLYVNSIKALTVSAVTLIFWGAVIQGGNTAEEFSAAFTMAAVYLALKAVNDEKRQSSKLYWYVYGLMTAFTALIRMVNCIVIAAIVVYMLVAMLKRHEFKRAVISCVIGLAGIATVTLPFMLYYYSKGALSEMIDAILLFSIRYTDFNKSSQNIVYFGYLISSAAIAIWGIIQGERRLSPLLLVTDIFCTLLYLKMGTHYPHYMGLGIPCVTIGVMLLFKLFENKRNVKAVAAVVLAFALVNGRYVTLCANLTLHELMNIAAGDVKAENVVFAEHIAELIPEEDKGDVYSYGVEAVIPYVADTYSKSKYFVSQRQWIKDEAMREKLYTDFVDTNSRYAITNADTNDIIGEYIHQNYTAIYEYGKYVLYEINKDN